MGLTTNLVRGARASRVMLLLHGYGADETDLAQLVPHLDPQGHFLVVLPRGQYSAPPGYAWFQFGGPPGLTAGQLQSSMASVEEVLDQALEDHGMRREDAVFAGFSQGASVAMALAVQDKAPPAGVLVMSGFLALDDQAVAQLKGRSLPPFLVQHGTDDQVVPVHAGRRVASGLAEAGAPVIFREYPMDHQIALESVQDAREWLDRIRAGERPSEPVAAVADEPAESGEEAAPAPPDGTVRDVSSRTFDREVLRSDVPVIVDFWAPWCQPCRMVSPIVEQVARMRHGSYKVVKVNVDEAPDLAQRYQVQSLPMVALFRNGRLERRSVGAKPRQQLEAELGMLVIP